MTQIYKIDVSGEQWRENAERIISQWGSLTVLDAEGNDTGIHTQGLAALYRKGRRNYLWRGNYVPLQVRGRLLSSEIEGTMILYKAGQSGGREFAHKYPVRLSGNRYSIVTGNPQPLFAYADDNDLLTADGDENHLENPAFLLWASEHVKDYHLMALGRNHRAAVAYKKRCWYVWLLENMSRADYDYHFEAAIEREGAIRAGYVLWKDGEVIKFYSAGNMEIHLNI